MSYLLSRLPPFAADYSGFASALHDLGGLVVIHDASGCTGSYTGYDEPRWFSSTSSVFCSGLRELDAIMGDDGKLLANIMDICANKDYSFIAIIGSPVPMLVGFDYDGFSNMAALETGLPVFGFPATGLGLYHDGLSAAFLEIARRFVTRPDMTSARSGANILGASPIDNFDAEAVQYLSRFLENAGFPVLSVWGQHTSLADLRHAATAEVNLVVAASAIPLARYMEKHWGIPWVAGLPLDEQAKSEIMQQLSHAAKNMPRDDETIKSHASPPADMTGGKVFPDKVLLVGEQLRMTAIRRALARRQPDLVIRIASFFAWEPALAEDGDCFLTEEKQAMDWIAQENPACLVGDPLLHQLLPQHASIHFINDPHLAVSGRLYPYSVADYFGKEGMAWMESDLKEKYALS